MKTCGYCGNEYEEKESKCPHCGSTLLKHTKGAESAAGEYRRIEKEIRNKRKSRSMILSIGAGVIVLIIFIAIWGVVNYLNDPQREIDKKAKALYEVAVQQIKDGDYNDAIETLCDINISWSDYVKVEEKKVEAVKGQLTNTIAQYESAGDYESIITYINDHTEDIESDTELSQIYNSSVQKYKEDVLQKTDAYIALDEYTSAKSILMTASNLIGSDSDIESKLNDVCQKEVLATVIGYENEQKYAEVITYVYDNLETIKNNSEILMKLSDCEQKYRESVINNAENAYKEEGYQAALAILKESLSVLEHDEIILNQVEKYKGFAPVSLLELDTFYSNYDGTEGYKKQIQSMKDKLGNVYENCLEYTYGSKESRDIYVISKQYKKFSGTIFVPVDRKSVYDDWTYQDYYFSIYGDDVLLYHSPKMTSKQYPVDFEVDISGVEQLSINWNGGACTWYYELGLTNAYLYK